VSAEQMLKVKNVSDTSHGSPFARYRELYYGDMSPAKALYGELVTLLFSGTAGALGLAARGLLYRPLFAEIGKGVVIGRNVTIRHPHRIRLGRGVILDDNTVVDAKGVDNRGITIGEGVYVGRNTILYTKNGNLAIGDHVNISSNCQFVSSNDMTVGPWTVIGAYTYLLSGGGYDHGPAAARFSEQNGYLTHGPLTIGANCWLGAGVVILDAASVGEHCVVAAGAVVTKPVPPNTIVGGVPAQPIRTLEPRAPAPGA
jgi:acetyltransferase-like isoleucine patch superfamily enzyme